MEQRNLKNQRKLKFDELNQLNPYEYCDKVCKTMLKRFLFRFTEAKGYLLNKSPREVIRYSKDMYDEIEELSEIYLLKIAKDTNPYLDRTWVQEQLKDYNPVTKYVWMNEVDRKRSRFAESIISTDGDFAKEIDTAMKLWIRMFNQYAIDIVDIALIDGYKRKGEKYVMWITQEDERVCDYCGELHGKVFSIKHTPSKGHWGCRCFLIPFRKES